MNDYARAPKKGTRDRQIADHRAAKAQIGATAEGAPDTMGTGLPCESHRRQNIRKDGRTRTHKRKTPSGKWRPQSEKFMKAKADREASRIVNRWWLYNY